MHDREARSVEDMLERGSESAVGEFIRIDYSNVHLAFEGIPDAHVDLVTLNQGLHHFPLNQLSPFLLHVERVLRPGGIFILREHNASSELYPMLDIAHAVFNAATGVEPREEASELRAFRPVLEWRAIVEGVTNLKDSMLYEMEVGDPTYDEMLCFYKPPLYPLDVSDDSSSSLSLSSSATLSGPVDPSHPSQSSSSSPTTDVSSLVGDLELSSIVNDRAWSLLRYLLIQLPRVHAFVKDRLGSAMTQGQRFVLNPYLDGIFKPVIETLQRFEVYAARSKPKTRESSGHAGVSTGSINECVDCLSCMGFVFTSLPCLTPLLSSLVASRFYIFCLFSFSFVNCSLLSFFPS